MSRKSKNRQGLTLLELVVVLVILVALAGILVPLLPGMLGRAHTAEHGTNVTEINKAVEAFNLINRSYPDGLDQLTAYAVIPGANAGGTNACSGELVNVTLTATDVAALNAAGVINVYPLDTAATRELVTSPYTAAPPRCWPPALWRDSAWAPRPACTTTPVPPASTSYLASDPAAR